MQLVYRIILMLATALVISGACAQVDDDRFIDSPINENDFLIEPPIKDKEGIIIGFTSKGLDTSSLGEAHRLTMKIVESIFLKDTAYLYANVDTILYESIPELVDFVDRALGEGNKFDGDAISAKVILPLKYLSMKNSSFYFKGTYSSSEQESNVVNYSGRIAFSKSSKLYQKIIEIKLTNSFSEEVFLAPLRKVEMQNLMHLYPHRIKDEDLYNVSSKLITDIDWLKDQDGSLYQNDWGTYAALEAGLVALAASDSVLFNRVLALCELNRYPLKKHKRYLLMISKWLSGEDISEEYKSFRSTWAVPERFDIRFEKHIAIFDRFGLVHPDPATLLRED